MGVIVIIIRSAINSGIISNMIQDIVGVIIYVIIMIINKNDVQKEMINRSISMFKKLKSGDYHFLILYIYRTKSYA